MVSLSAAMLFDAAIDEVDRAVSSFSEAGVNDPRLIEQPDSAIVISRIEQDARRPEREALEGSREAPEKG